MSGPAFVDGATFSAAVLCLLGHVHLHLVDADFDGPTGIVLRKYVSLLSSIVATRSGPSGLWPQRNLKFPPRRPDQPLNNLQSQSIRNTLISPMANLVGRTCLYEVAEGHANADSQARRLD